MDTRTYVKTDRVSGIVGGGSVAFRVRRAGIDAVQWALRVPGIRQEPLRGNRL